MKKTNTILAVTLSVLTGCGEQKSMTGDVVTVDVTKNYPKKELILQDFLDVEYIPLETSSEFITMAHVEAIGKEVIVVRNRNRSSDGDIFFFDAGNGKGLKKINRLGQGGEEYIFLLGVTLDEDNGEIFVNDHYSKKVFAYDLSGKFKRSFAHSAHVAGSYYNRIYNFDREHLICHEFNADMDRTSDRSIFQVISKQDGSVTREIRIPYHEKKSTVLMLIDEASGEGIMAGARNEELILFRDGWLLVEPSSDTIYRLQPDYSLTPHIARTPSIRSMNPEIFLFPGVLTDRYTFMQTVKRTYDFVVNAGFPRTDLVYDRQENALYRYVAYNADFTDKKPVNLTYGNGITLINGSEIAFLQKLEAYELVEAYEKGRLKGRLKEIAAGLDEESNPVIMLAKHKKN
ncbi:MAG: 6-bladed beta-propeller [Tannerella sp.]|jgi:hypothetical protein|nr:6-bladed beta-propeller [Tannerella sp.]